MANLAPTGATVAVFRPVTVIFHTKAVHHVGPFSDVQDGIDVQVIHHVAGIVVHLDAGVIYRAQWGRAS